MKRIWLAVLVLVSCGKPAPQPVQEEYVDSELGVDVREDAPLSQTTLANGDEELTGSDTVKVNGEEHDVSIDEDIAPASNGGKETLTVVDKSTNDKRIFTFDPATNTITFSDGTNSLNVVKNPDSSYTVDNQPAANGKAAVALLKNNPVYANQSAWSFIATYTRCQTCLELAASRTAVDCGNSGATRADSPPAVCDIMRDLCDCAECDKAGKATCAKCP